MREPVRARVASLAVLLLAVLLVAGSAAHYVVQRDRARAELDHRLIVSVREEAAVLDNYFERARSTILITAQNPAFASFYSVRGDRVSKVREGGKEIRQINGALAYLQTLYPTSIGEACYIHLTGPENARVVRGAYAPPAELSPDESQNPFFGPTFDLDFGEVYQAQPYVSPDTGEWVISNSTLVPFADGVKRAFVHFEVTVESFRMEASSVADDVDVRVVDAQDGSVLIDGLQPQRIGAPLGLPADTRFSPLAQITDPEGTIDIGGLRAAFRPLSFSTSNANRWLVVATPAAGSRLASVGLLPLLMFAAALVLLLAALLNYLRVSRALHRQEVRLAQQAERLRTAQSERGQLLQQVVDASEEERRRLARELHDGPIQRLTEIDIRLELLKLNLDSSRSTDSDSIADVQGGLRTEITGLRSAMTQLRPPVLDERGLGPALSDYAAAIARTASLRCGIGTDIDGRLDPATETIVYRVAQEALNNVVKHARATQVDVLLTASNGSVVLEIEDDGVGFDLSEQANFLQAGHAGLAGMRERIELAGGTWKLSSDPGRGTRIRAEVPR
jgi:signal transduction histidine kinase